MEIHASSRYDIKTVIALCRMFRVKKTTPVLHLVLMLLAYAFVAGVCIAVIVGKGADTFIAALFCICVVAICAELAIFFVLPRLQYKNMADLRNAENRFIFRDDGFDVVTDGEHQHAEAKVSYSALVRVVETRAYIYLFQTKNQTFIVDRKSISAEEMPVLRRCIAEKIGKRYSIYRY